MRKLVLLRGLPGCGKSTFVKENKLESYTVSSDQIRLLIASTSMDTEGNIGISSLEDKTVWNKIYEILEFRFKKGLFTVFDATNIKTGDINKLKKVASKYNYKIYCVDFTDIPIEVVKERNLNREELRRVPEIVIDRMHEKLLSSSVPNDIEIIKPYEFQKVFYEVKDLSKWKAIHFIGDIHGCYDALVKLIGEIKRDEMYVFCGDYIDRGIQNAKTLNYLFELNQRKNVVFLEGNHEKHLSDWLNNDHIVSEVFKTQTLTELENGGISLKKARKFRESLEEFIYIVYNGKRIFACHGGIPFIPEVIDFVSADQFIRGVGKYTDCEQVENKFAENHKDIYLVHGHRNINKENINPIPNVFNLENAVEFGGSLRMVTFEGDKIYTTEIVNDVFNKQNEMKPSDVEQIISNLRDNEYVNEKQFGNISSFNFSRTAFENKIWNEQTITARGLYIDTEANKIVARSYNKFFTINENEQHQFGILKQNLSYPITAYKKENGFLGIFSSHQGQPFFATKSSIDGDFNTYFKTLMYDIYGKDKINEMNFHCNKNNCTLVFEVIDTKNDPHIIEYEDDTVVLLDIIKNDINFSKLPYNQLTDVAKDIGLKVKEKVNVIFTPKEFEKFYNSIITDENKKYGNIEGFVFEDDKGFMFKLKTPYYNFWKFMRGVANGVSKNGRYRREDLLTDETAKEFYGWLTTQYQKGIIYDSDKIIEIRKDFENR
jgi:predicted kinase